MKSAVDWMDACFWGVHKEIFDPDAGLFYRDARSKTPEDEEREKSVVGTGQRANLVMQAMRWVLAKQVRRFEHEKKFWPLGITSDFIPERSFQKRKGRQSCAN